MQLVFAGEPYPQHVSKVLFLAGTTNNSQTNLSWRDEALALLASSGFDGTVYLPQGKNADTANHAPSTILDQRQWELGALKRSDCVIFWFTDDIHSTQHAITTIELGWLIESGTLLLGTTINNEHAFHLRSYAQHFNLPYYTTLNEVILAAIKNIGEGASRDGGETAIPLAVWRTASFQEWLGAQKKAGNRLDDARVEWLGRIIPQRTFVFFWIIYVKVWINDENRYKDNEWILGRNSIATVLLYQTHLTQPLETKIVLIKEFRSPASNSQAKIYELPGGSSFKPGVSPYTLALQEVAEETGFTITAQHIVHSHLARQLCGTTLTHKSHLFSVELSPTDMQIIEQSLEQTFGNLVDTERTTIHILPLKSILSCDYVDYATLGMILQALTDDGILF